MSKMNKVPFKGIFLGKQTKFDAINGDKVFYRLEFRIKTQRKAQGDPSTDKTQNSSKRWFNLLN